jgi:hypothetical protein
MRLQVAITNAQAATPVMRTASVVIPQARLVSKVTQLATGKFAFVGSARAEAKLTDATTGEVLGEWLEQQVGGNNIKTAATGSGRTRSGSWTTGPAALPKALTRRFTVAQWLRPTEQVQLLVPNPRRGAWISQGAKLARSKCS